MTPNETLEILFSAAIGILILLIFAALVIPMFFGEDEDDDPAVPLPDKWRKLND